MSSNWGSNSRSNSSGSSSRSDVENSFDDEELLQIGTRCMELRREKEMLRESQSQSIELVRRLELNANSLSESCLEDKRRIQILEKELLNCYQEIDYLRDQVSFRGQEMNDLSEHVLDLEVKVTESGRLEEEVNYLREELCTSKSEQLLLLQELESTETELQLSLFSVEKLEESFSSLTLESQCEIESMKLDIAALEETLFDAQKFQGESIQKNDKLEEMVKELRGQKHANMLSQSEARVKDGSDKKLLVDIMFWAMENQAPANIMLISGDKDFSYLLHKLGMKRYNILLARPEKASTPLIAAGKTVWLWTSIVNGDRPNRSIDIGRHHRDSGSEVLRLLGPKQAQRTKRYRSSCELCNVVCSNHDLTSHLSGKRHRTNVLLVARHERPLVSNLTEPKSAWCGVCHISFRSEARYETHILGQSHQEELEDQRAFQKALPQDPIKVSLKDLE